MANGVLSFPLTSFHARRLPRPGRLPRVCRRAASPPPPAPSSRPAAPASSSHWTRTSTGRSSPSPSRRPPGRLPVVAGTGYGWAQAARFARIAEDAGRRRPPRPPALPGRRPAGRAGRPAGADRRPHPAPAHRLPARPGRLRRRRVQAHRPIPGVIGLKDGHSDLDRLQRLTLAAPEDFLFFNGASTAEIQARAYATVGVPAYSSAVHAFAPEIANAFFTALRDGDDGTVDKLLRDFYVPLVELRDRVPGYAVSLVKAAARLRGRPVGPVRAPLTDPSAADLADLKTLLTTGLDLVGAAL